MRQLALILDHVTCTWMLMFLCKAAPGSISLNQSRSLCLGSVRDPAWRSRVRTEGAAALGHCGNSAQQEHDRSGATIALQHSD